MALGKGHFGRVTLCQWHPTSSFVESAANPLPSRGLVAVKQLLEGASLNEQAHFLIEARVMASLQHPHLVQFLGVMQRQLPFLMLTEYMVNGDLKVCCLVALQKQLLMM
jgi:serine/threonine protein kinase